MRRTESIQGDNGSQRRNNRGEHPPFRQTIPAARNNQTCALDVNGAVWRTFPCPAPLN